MSEPTPPRDPGAPPHGAHTPSPFDRPDEPLAPGSGRSGGRGIRKPLLIGCGVLLLLAFAALAVFVIYQNSIAAWVMEAMHTELAGRLPEDLPDDVRARYEDAFELAVAAAREGDYAPQDLQRVQQEFSRAVQQGGSRLSVEEVERLAGVLEEFPSHGEAAPGEDLPAERP